MKRPAWYFVNVSTAVLAANDYISIEEPEHEFRTSFLLVESEVAPITQTVAVLGSRLRTEKQNQKRLNFEKSSTWEIAVLF